MLPRWLKPQVLIGLALVLLLVAIALWQSGRDDSPGGQSLDREEFMRIAGNDRSLPGADPGSGREAFRETLDASAGTSMTFEIPPGMTIYVRGDIASGSVHLMIDPVWTDPRIVELPAGSSSRALITNGSENKGRINIRSTPIGDVQGSFTLYAE